jgi:ABC-type branched-subunit amino acid transport system ATPase component
MSTTGLHARDLCVERDGRGLLDVAALDVPTSSCTVIEGGGDAGKTLLAAALAGAVLDAGGEVRIGNRRCSGPPSSRLRHGLAVVPNDVIRIRGVTVTEALTLARRGTRRVSDAFDRFPLLAARRTLRTDRLSGGEHQTLRIACAYLAMPAALVLDSPTTGLAASLVDAVLALARDEAARGAAVLWLDQPGAPVPNAATLRLDAGRLSAAAESRTVSLRESG